MVSASHCLDPDDRPNRGYDSETAPQKSKIGMNWNVTLPSSSPTVTAAKSACVLKSLGI
jgi:hypothetical protein